MNNRITIFIPWMIILFILQTNFIVALAQDNPTVVHGINDSATYSIKWIKQFPSIENQSKEGIVKHLFDFFFAKNTFELSKPVSIIATNPDTFWVLDQGNMAVFQVENQMIENPQLPNNSLRTPDLIFINQCIVKFAS